MAAQVSVRAPPLDILPISPKGVPGALDAKCMCVVVVVVVRGQKLAAREY